MSRPLFRRNPMASQWSEKHPERKKQGEVFLSLDPAGNSSTGSLLITTLVDGILYLPTPPPVDPLIMLRLPSERWSAVDRDYLMNWLDRSSYWRWVTLPPKPSSTRVRVLRLLESDRQSRAPQWQGQKLLLRSTLHSVSATEMPSLHWSTTWESLCDRCSHGIPLSMW